MSRSPGSEVQEDVELDDSRQRKLLDYRGGCGCGHPPFNPPCNNCCDPLTYDEMEDLGWKLYRTPITQQWMIVDEDDSIYDRLPDARNASTTPPDAGKQIMDVTRDMFRKKYT